MRPPWAARWHRRSGRAALLWGRGLSEGTHRGPARPMALRLTTRGAVRGDVRRPLIGCGGAAAEPAGRGARGAGPPRSPRAIAAASPAPPGLPRSGPGSAALPRPGGGDVPDVPPGPALPGWVRDSRPAAACAKPAPLRGVWACCQAGKEGLGSVVLWLLNAGEIHGVAAFAEC